MHTQSKIIPGLINHGIEFFVVEDTVKAINAGKVIDFTEFPLSVIELLKKEMMKSKDVILALHDFHPFNEMDRIEQFAKCRFGGLDLTADIIDNVVQDGEYVDCPNRGTCPHEGILCKLPIYNGERLTAQQVKLMQLSSSEKTNEVIAEDMGMAMGTFHKAKKNIHQFLGVQTKQGMTIISNFLNLI